MKRYKNIFSSFHTLYRLTTTSDNMKDFVIGIARLYKNIFKADTVVAAVKNADTSLSSFIKVRIEEKKQYVKKGGISILTKREKYIFNEDKEMIFDNRLIYPFIFTDTLGVIYVKKNSKSKVFTELEKEWFISISDITSICLKIYNLYQEQRKILIGYIKALTKLLNMYVPVSRLHTKSVSRLITALGKELKLSSSEIVSLKYASLLHDAGKLQIPPEVLGKQMPLTDEEYRMIMKHPRDGIKLIKDLEALKPVIPIILHHHEKYNGGGYPSRLKKEQIPLGSRILAVIDAFDAMFFGRPYKKRMDLNEVMKELERQKGIQFDPKIVDVFLQILKRKSIRKYLHSFL